MGYRYKLGILKKKEHEKIKDLTYEDLLRKYQEDEDDPSISVSNLTREIFQIKGLLRFDYDVSKMTPGEIIENCLIWVGLEKLPVKTEFLDFQLDSSRTLYVIKAGELYIKFRQPAIELFTLMVSEKRFDEGYVGLRSFDKKISQIELDFFKKTYGNLLKRKTNL